MRPKYEVVRRKQPPNVLRTTRAPYLHTSTGTCTAVDLLVHVYTIHSTSIESSAVDLRMRIYRCTQGWQQRSKAHPGVQHRSRQCLTSLVVRSSLASCSLITLGLVGTTAETAKDSALGHLGYVDDFRPAGYVVHCHDPADFARQRLRCARSHHAGTGSSARRHTLPQTLRCSLSRAALEPASA